MAKMKVILGIALGLVLLGGAGAMLLLNRLLQPVDPTNATREKFIIPSGQSVSRIAERLEDEGLIQNAVVFRLVVSQQNLESKLQAGSFELSPALSPIEIATRLTQGTEDLWITIPEGWRTEEIAESLTQYELSQYDEAEFLEAADGLEGQLFPDTYLISRESTAEQIVHMLQGTYQTKVVKGLADEIANSNRSYSDIMVMASLVEREAREYTQMQHVASILWNRIDIGMPLQVDATLQYAKGYDTSQQRWWSTPTRDDKRVTSAFNTYLNAGLPPQPICNPGLNAFKAALDPLQTDDLYYLHATSGEMYFGQSLDQHNANIQRYLR